MTEKIVKIELSERLKIVRVPLTALVESSNVSSQLVTVVPGELALSMKMLVIDPNVPLLNLTTPVPGSASVVVVENV